VIGGDRGEFRDELLTFSAADTFVKGTILARQEVVLAITPVAGANVGTGTCTNASVVAGTLVPRAGVYTLRCTEAVLDGGIWRLEDSTGVPLISDLRMTADVGAATVFNAHGLQFTVTDGTTDFALNDTFTLPVVADGKLVPYAIAGAGGAQVPMAILTYDATLSSAGNLRVRVLVSGDVKKERLIIDADGNGSNVNASVIDAMQRARITVTSTQQLGD
jgi:hypothetical protein